MTQSGRVGSSTSPSSRWSAALHAALPARSSAEKLAAMPESVLGSYSCVSMPFRIPCSFQARSRKISSRPSP